MRMFLAILLGLNVLWPAMAQAQCAPPMTWPIFRSAFLEVNEDTSFYEVHSDRVKAPDLLGYFHKPGNKKGFTVLIAVENGCARYVSNVPATAKAPSPMPRN